MRKTITFFILFFASVSVWAGDDVITASNFVPQAMLAKQIAPGTSRSFSLGNSYISCDSKTASDTHRLLQNTQLLHCKERHRWTQFPH